MDILGFSVKLDLNLITFITLITRLVSSTRLTCETPQPCNSLATLSSLGTQHTAPIWVFVLLLDVQASLYLTCVRVWPLSQKLPKCSSPRSWIALFYLPMYVKIVCETYFILWPLSSIMKLVFWVFDNFWI